MTRWSDVLEVVMSTMEELDVLLEGLVPRRDSWKGLTDWFSEAYEHAPALIPDALERVEPAMVGWDPWVRVLPDNWRGDWLSGAQRPYLSLVRHVACTPEDLEEALSSPHMDTLLSLGLDGVAGLPELFERESYPQLQHFSCEDWEHHCELAWVALWREHSLWQQLTEVTLSFEMEKAGWDALFATPFMPACRTLNFDEICPAEALTSLAHSDVFQQLTAFFVNGFECSDETHAQLLRALEQSPIEKLELFGLDNKGERLRALGQVSMPHLTQLHLDDVSPMPTDSDIDILLSASCLPQLDSLSFTTYGIGANALASLCEAEQLKPAVRDSFRSGFDYKHKELEEGLELVRELLSESLTPTSWKRLLKLAKAHWHASRESFGEVWLPYVRQHIDSWPDEARTLSLQLNGEAFLFLLPKCLDLSEFFIGDPEYHERSVAQVQAMLSFPDEGQLTSLRLPNWHIKASGEYLQRVIETLVTLPGYASLRHLGCEGSLINEEAAEALANAPYLGGLRSLTLEDCFLKQGETTFATLVSSPLMSGLESLDFSHNRLKDEDLLLMSKSPHLSGLASLSLAQNDFGPEGVSALLASDVVAGIRKISLAGARGNDDIFSLLAEAPHCAALEEVILFDCWGYAGGIDALLKAPWLSSCRKLDISCNGWEFPEYARLGQCEALQGLRWLAIGDEMFDSEAMAALADSPYLGAVETLEFDEGELDVAAFRALAHSEHMHSLRHLYLVYPGLHEKSIAMLEGAPLAQRLETFSIESDDSFDDDAAERLAAIELPSLKKLVLYGTQLSEEGMLALTQAPWMQQLEVLSVPRSLVSSTEAGRILRGLLLPSTRLESRH